MSQYGQGGIRGCYECNNCKQKFDFKIEREAHEQKCFDRPKQQVTKHEPEQDFGLSNGRNQFNCFINSVLQLFFNVKVLKNCIDEYANKAANNTNQYPEYKIANQIVALFAEAQDQINQNNTDSVPVLNPDPIRVEIFKYHYTMQTDFSLFQKADSTEIMQSLLDIIHFCLNQNPKKRTVDDVCYYDNKDKVCEIHKNLSLRTTISSTCKCKPNESREQRLHDNTFMIILPAQAIIKQLQTMINKGYYGHCLEKIAGCLFQANMTIYEQPEDKCIQGTPNCRYQQSTEIPYIDEPYPHIICVAVNWWSNEVPYIELLQFVLSIPSRVTINQIYYQMKSADRYNKPEYVLKGIVVFLGAHYQTLIKTKSQGAWCWKLYDDQHIKRIGTYEHVLHLFLDQAIQPTNLIFERVTPENSDIDKGDVMDQNDLDQLNAKAIEIQQSMDDIIQQFKSQDDIIPDMTSTRASTITSDNKSTQSKQHFEKSGKGSNPRKDLQDLKKKYKKDDIYIYECGQCKKFIMLHQRQCDYCKKDNYYYDPNLKIPGSLHNEVSDQLQQLMTKLGMKYQMAAPPLAGEDQSMVDQEDESTLAIGSTQKSLRKSDLNVGVGNIQIENKFDLAGVPKDLDQDFPQKNQKAHIEKPKVKEEKFTVYKCPKCKILNRFGEGNHCQNYFSKPQICKFDIEKAYDDEAAQLELDEITEHEYQLKIAEWNAERNSNSSSQNETHWFCQCKHKNVIDRQDTGSARCVKCGSTNDNVFQLISKCIDTASESKKIHQKPAAVPEVPAAAKTFKAEEWECEDCKTINQWQQSDPKSSYCRGCRTQNRNIHEMILLCSTYQRQDEEAKQNQKHHDQREHRERTKPSSSHHYPQNHKNQHKMVVVEDQEFEQIGDYYQCRVCDQFTVHINNDTVCKNAQCGSNSNRNKEKKRSTHSNNQSYYQQNQNQQCRTCHNALRPSDLYEEYNGHCQMCHKRTQSMHSRRQSRGQAEAGGSAYGGAGVPTSSSQYLNQPPTDYSRHGQADYSRSVTKDCRRCGVSYGMQARECTRCNVRL